MSIFNIFRTKYWIVHKPQSKKTYIISSCFAPANNYLYDYTGILVCAGPFDFRPSAECYLPTVLKELKPMI
jgi:hypothetical protein